ncbi:MAG: hypothetical protein JO171_01100 [Paludibacterium sp.]|uniref:hypothetical protein n=1 Tax=Paludibacterium sp. TaxID=1917523 RepID=UPI0025FA4839|nr:hypothetical protein [Paludibacterium sp.]MBV8045722.1 hypothetical protein [Paludibacterium sp.]MBV8467912.1 hypothetical protein [Burkholderiales bacterium]
MFPAFGYVDSAIKLGDYCRACLLDDERTHPPKVGNKTWEIYKCLRLTDELIRIFDELDVFKAAAEAGYRLREEPHLIRWTYTGSNRGAADHYHHDGHFGKGGQVSLMLLLEENVGKTHMRIIPNSRKSFGRKVYDALWKIPFKGRGRLFRLNDWFIEKFNKPIKLEGPKDRLYFFNAGDNLHKAFPVSGTTRTIFHLNLTLFESRLSAQDLSFCDRTNHSMHWAQLLSLSPNKA